MLPRETWLAVVIPECERRAAPVSPVCGCITCEWEPCPPYLPRVRQCRCGVSSAAVITAELHCCDSGITTTLRSNSHCLDRRGFRPIEITGGAAAPAGSPLQVPHCSPTNKQNSGGWDWMEAFHKFGLAPKKYVSGW